MSHEEGMTFVPGCMRRARYETVVQRKLKQVVLNINNQTLTKYSL